MMRRLIVILFACTMALQVYGYAQAKEPTGTKAAGIRYVSEFEGGKLYSAGKIKVVELTTPMGCGLLFFSRLFACITRTSL